MSKVNIFQFMQDKDGVILAYGMPSTDRERFLKDEQEQDDPEDRDDPMDFLELDLTTNEIFLAVLFDSSLCIESPHILDLEEFLCQAYRAGLEGKPFDLTRDQALERSGGIFTTVCDYFPQAADGLLSILTRLHQLGQSSEHSLSSDEDSP